MPEYRAWPFQEAGQLIRKVGEAGEEAVVFETGFGPSGLPHIGTFAEVARTTWVRHAFEALTGRRTKLIAFSDDMDGLRKVPLNMPQQEMLAQHIGKPLCHIPDPFGCHESYSAHMNAKLQEFLEAYGFDYQFQSSHEAYTRGDFNAGLSILLAKAAEVEAIIRPTLREENREDWTPFFPICARCGRVYTTRVTAYHPESNTLDYVCDQELHGVRGCGHRGTTSVLDGHVKVGWKVDWALRWYTYDVAYEMYGKDLTESAQLSARIVRLMGKQPPIGLIYELFLDQDGKKISKSVGRGLTVDAWQSYAPIESLLYYIFASPRKAKRLYWEIVPRCVDDYLDELRRYPAMSADEQVNSPIWHVHNRGREVPTYTAAVSYSMVDNLLSALATDSPELVMEYLERYDPRVPENAAIVRDLVHKVLNYYRDFVLPTRTYRQPGTEERAMLLALRDRLIAHEGENVDELQAIPFAVAEEFNVPAPAFFQLFYQVVLGQERGPRFGSFALLIGKDKLARLIAERAGGE